MKTIRNTQKRSLFRLLRKAQRGQSLVEFALSLTVLVLIFSGAIDLGRAMFTRIMLDSVVSEGAHWAAAYPGCIKYGTAWNETDAPNIPDNCIGDKSIKGRMKYESNMDQARLIYSGLIPPAGKTEAEIAIGDTITLKATYRMELLTPVLRGMFGPTLDISSEVKEVVRGDGIPETNGSGMDCTGDCKPPTVKDFKQSGACTYNGTTDSQPYLQFTSLGNQVTGYRIFHIGAGGATGAQEGSDIPTTTAGSTIITPFRVPVADVQGLAYDDTVSKEYRVLGYITVSGSPVYSDVADTTVECTSPQPKIDTLTPANNFFCSTNGATMEWKVDIDPVSTDGYVNKYGVFKVGATLTTQALATIAVSGGADYQLPFTFSAPTDGTGTYFIRGIHTADNSFFGLPSANFTIDCQYQADLSITKVASTSNYQTTKTLNYIITITNNTEKQIVTDAKVQDFFPVEAGTPMTWTCVPVTVTDQVGTSSCSHASGSGNLTDEKITLAGAKDDPDADTIGNGGQVVFYTSSVVPSTTSGTISNTARVDVPDAVSDPNTANNQVIFNITPGTVSDTDLVTSTITTNQSPMNNYSPGGSITYTFSVTNNGPTPVSDAVINLTVPTQLSVNSWTCVQPNNNVHTGTTNCYVTTGPGNVPTFFTDLAVGETANVTVTATVASGTTGTFDFIVTATPPGGVSEKTVSDNQSKFTSGISTDLSISHVPAADPSTYSPNVSFSYDLIVSNNGSENVPQANVSITVPSPMDYTQITWTCTNNYTGTATCPAAGGTFTGSTTAINGISLNGLSSVKITVTVIPPGSAATTFQTSANVAIASAGITETDTSNNSVTHIWNYTPAPPTPTPTPSPTKTSTPTLTPTDGVTNLQVTLSPTSGNFTPGLTLLTFTLTLDNQSNSSDSPVSVDWTDSNGALQNTVWCQNDKSTCTPTTSSGTSSFTISGLTIPSKSQGPKYIIVQQAVSAAFAGQSLVVSVIVHDSNGTDIIRTATFTHAATATPTATQGTPATATNTRTPTYTSTPQTSLSLVKTMSFSSFTPGGTLSYFTLEIDNSSNSNVGSVTMTWTDSSSALSSVKYCQSDKTTCVPSPGTSASGTFTISNITVPRASQDPHYIVLQGVVNASFAGNSFTINVTVHDPTNGADLTTSFTVNAVPTSTPTATLTRTPTATFTFTPSRTPTPCSGPCPTNTPTLTPTRTLTLTPSMTLTKSNTPTATFTPTMAPLTVSCNINGSNMDITFSFSNYWQTPTSVQVRASIHGNIPVNSWGIDSPTAGTTTINVKNTAAGYQPETFTVTLLSGSTILVTQSTTLPTCS